MNRLKVWVYALAVAAVAYAALRAHTGQLRASALRDLDARLAASSAQVVASVRVVAREASAAAAVAARDPKLLAALHAADAAPPAPLPRKGKKAPPPPAPPAVDAAAQDAALAEAARAALAGAARTLGSDLPEGTAISAGNREWLVRKGDAADAGEAAPFLRAAIAGKAQRGYVRVKAAVLHAAAAPAGDGAGVMVLAPVDDAWVRGVAAATGTVVTLAVPEARPISTAGADAQAFLRWTQGAGMAADVGQLGKVPLAVGPVKLGAVPPPFGAAPAYRARAVALDGLKGGFVVIAVPAAPALTAIAQFHWLAVLAIAVALLVGLVLGLFVKSPEAPAALPEELIAAAARIERGDFAARVPPLAGTFGTVAAALNRAAELAGPAAAAKTARPSVTDEFFAKAPGAALAPAPEPEQAQPEQPAPEPPPEAKPAPETAPEPAPEPAAAAPSPVPAPAPAPAPAILDAARAAPPPTAAAAPESEEDTHFRQVFQEFLRTRASCGEPSEGLSYEKFRLKLDGNKAALVAKYACKTVRFQVYVKDGRAALKATPVR